MPSSANAPATGTPRRLHFVGTLPQFSSPQAAIEWQRAELAGALSQWYGGETGDRSLWFVPVIKRLQASEKIRTVRHGTWSDYDDVDRLAVRRRVSLTPTDIPLRIADHFTEELALIPADSSLPIQVGIPGFFDMALFIFGPVGAVRHARTFRRALGAEIDAVQSIAPDRALFQLEVPAALIAICSAPRALRPILARLMAHQVLKQVRSAPEGSRFGIHLCLGDLGHHAAKQLDDASPLVLLSNAVVRYWPKGRTLEFIHLPLSGGAEPPSTDADFYEPLHRLATNSIRIVAGLAHEDQSFAEQQRVLDLVEERIGRRVDVATSCGLGRRKPIEADAAVRRMRELAEVSDESESAA